jgi:hypothetical protein
MRSKSFVSVFTLVIVVGFLILPIGSAFGETWTKVNTSGFNNSKNATVSSGAVYNNKLYVGTGNSTEGCSVWRFDGGTTWTRVGNPGFDGDLNNVAVSGMAVFGSYLYASTTNITTGAEVWRYNGSAWAKANADGFGTGLSMMIYSSSLVSFNGYLYASGGFPLSLMWRTSNGTSWTQVFASGTNDMDHYICSMAATSTTLYAGTYNVTYGSKLLSSTNGTTWTQVNTNGFGDVSNREAYLYADSANLYVGTGDNYMGCEVWKYAGGTWSQINTNGFGSAANQYAHPMTYGGNLYVGVGNSLTGCTVWKYVSGTTWTQMNTAGFGTTANRRVRLFTYNNSIYAGTENGTNGCEVWSTPAAAPGLAVTGVTPASGTVDTTVNITLAGTGFVQGSTTTQVRLERAGATTINATGVAVPLTTQITCTVNLTGAQTGAYNVLVRNPNGTEAVLANGFTVNAVNPCGGGAAASVALAGLMFGLLSLAGSGTLRRRLRGNRG